LREQEPASVLARRSGVRAAATSFCHLPEVERLLSGKGVPVIGLLAQARLETLHRLAQLPSGTRVGVAPAVANTAHNLEHSIATAGLPNVALVGACPTKGAALGRLVRGWTSSSPPDPRPSGSRGSRAPPCR
jgi:hypothetical protein